MSGRSAPAFSYDILGAVEHRRWPMPAGPWIMTQSWHDLLFAHWPVDAHLLAARVPASFALDRYDGQAWLGIVAFHMTNVAPRGIPSLPFVSAFPELNVRTYVTRDGKPGVYFFSLDADSALAVLGARTLFNLPYFSAAMEVTSKGSEILYSSRRRGRGVGQARFIGRWTPIGAVQPPGPGTLEHFLTERYCLYALDRSSRPRRLEIHHPPWPLQVAEAQITVNTMAAAAGIALPGSTPLLHFARRQDVVAWPMERIRAAPDHPSPSRQ